MAKAPKSLADTPRNARDGLPKKPKIAHASELKHGEDEKHGSSLRNGENVSTNQNHALWRRNTKGMLALLPDLPLDVLFEIFGHLLPADILHLTRTTKVFRRVLLHRSAISIWKAALANVPTLPECPPDMSLPGWTNLVFDSHCHNCGNAHVRNVLDFNLHVRLCGKCAKICLFSAKNLDEKSKRDKLILRCVPFSKWNNGDIQFCLLAAKNDFLKKMGDPNRDRNAFVKDRTTAIKVRKEHAKRCKVWFEKQVAQSQREVNKIKNERKEAITKKLNELGYKEETKYLEKLAVDALYSWPPPVICLLHEHPSVKVPKPLTEQMWLNMKPKMIAYMADVKAYRANEERLSLLEDRRILAHRAWRNYREKHPTTRFMPSPVTILEWPLVRSQIELPSEHAVTEVTFRVLFDKELPGFLAEFWQVEADKLARKHPCNWPCIPTDIYGSGVHKLELAICVFKCRGGIHLRDPECDPDTEFEPPLFYPEFLHHPCNSIGYRHGRDPEAETDEEVDALDSNPSLSVDKQYKGCRRKAWSSQKLDPDEKASRVVKTIVEACGQDPRTTTVTAMDQLDPRLVCLKCTFGAKPDGERLCSVWTWRNAVNHCMKVHWGSSAVTWQKISDEDVVQARVLEAKEPERRHLSPLRPKIWRCTGCVDDTQDPGRMTMDEVLTHYDYVHGLDEVEAYEEGELYMKAPECAPPQPLTVKMIPKEVKPAQDI
ncbi:hypothetical protein Hypma_008472 [Hypsizygus marmoreus]|uniref:F-box domain-containing protein n=1 Tax=Hypsizygus marmoreus TaxID=39966 RepID=A0A369JQ87_HYPMA|nr:hypothetical protein Hypma_008472 [Hypsizygus marmoreus]